MKSKKIRAIVRALDPTTTTKLYEVEGSDYYGGRCWCFWTKKAALKKAKEISKSYIYVILHDCLRDKKIIVSNSREGQIPVIDEHGIHHGEWVKA